MCDRGLGGERSFVCANFPRIQSRLRTLGCCSSVNVVSSADEEEIVRRLYPALRRFAAVVGGLDVEPDDLVHDALVNTMRIRPLGELDAPEAYLCRAILNGARNARRNRWRRNAAVLRLGSRTQEPTDYPSDLSDLEHLAPEDRAVLYLKVVEDLPYEQIARLLGISEVAARQRASRSVTRLRTILVEELEHG